MEPYEVLERRRLWNKYMSQSLPFMLLGLGAMPRIVTYQNSGCRPYVTPQEKARRRAANKRAKLSRKRNRLAA